MFLSEVPSFVFLSELTPSSRPVRDRHVDDMRYRRYLQLVTIALISNAVIGQI